MLQGLRNQVFTELSECWNSTTHNRKKEQDTQTSRVCAGSLMCTSFFESLVCSVGIQSIDRTKKRTWQVSAVLNLHVLRCAVLLLLLPQRACSRLFFTALLLTAFQNLSGSFPELAWQMKHCFCSHVKSRDEIIYLQASSHPTVVFNSGCAQMHYSIYIISSWDLTALR